MLNSRLKVKLGSWLKERGPWSPIVISSRMRLARNLKDFFFPHRADEKQLAEVRSLIGDVVVNDPALKEFTFIPLEELSLLDRLMLLEEHLISPDFSAGGKRRAVVLSHDGQVSIMVNEEDHLRIQSLLSGLQLLETKRVVDEIDERLSVHLDFAFLENWGYLTACPTNVGTAMRASVMMHLPGLVMAKRMRGVVDFLSERGTAVRGLFGEGTRALGNLYQISNQITLGEAEEEIITVLSEVCREVVKEEEKARKILLKDDEMGALDGVYRALGILSYAKKVSFEEAIDLLSTLRLGVETGLLPSFDGINLNELMFLVRPAHLQNFIKRSLPEEEQDIARASLIKERLSLQGS